MPERVRKVEAALSLRASTQYLLDTSWDLQHSVHANWHERPAACQIYLKPLSEYAISRSCNDQKRAGVKYCCCEKLISRLPQATALPSDDYNH